ncbi:RasGAP domain-containing protein, partial [bacterium]|nr:RasGAP domain-containing protein [bacterium]
MSTPPENPRLQKTRPRARAVRLRRDEGLQVRQETRDSSEIDLAELDALLEEFSTTTSSPPPPRRKPPAPPTSETTVSPELVEEDFGSKVGEVMEEMNAPYLATARLKSFQTILWPKNPSWYKGLGNFKKLVQKPYLDLVAIFQTSNEEKTGYTKELRAAVMAFEGNCRKQSGIYKKNVTSTQEKIDDASTKGKKPKKGDLEKVDFLNKKIEMIFNLGDNITNLRSQLFEIPEISHGFDIMSQDPLTLEEGEREAAAKSIAKSLTGLLASDPDTFNKIVTSKIDPNTLVDIFDQLDSTVLDKVIKNIIIPNIDDKEYINALAITAIQKSAAESGAQGAFFRGNDAVSKTVKFIFESDQNCQEYAQGFCTDYLEEGKAIKEPTEVDPYKLQKIGIGTIEGYEEMNAEEQGAALFAQLTQENQEAVLQNRRDLLVHANKLLATLTSTVPPDQVCLLSHTTIDAFEKKFPEANKENSYEKVGGMIFLRYLLPPLIGNDWLVKEELGSFTPEEWAAGKRTAVLASKMMQNLANNKDFSSKESYMTAFNPWIASNQGTMNDYFDRVLAKGKELATTGDYSSFASPTSSKSASTVKGKTEATGMDDIDLGESHGIFSMGRADGTGLNCLIDSIGKALGINTTNTEREEIRKTLISMNLAKKNEFLYNDQPILSAILQGLDRRPGDANIFFVTDDSTVVDNQTYNMRAGTTIYIHNDNNVHFS